MPTTNGVTNWHFSLPGEWQNRQAEYYAVDPPSRDHSHEMPRSLLSKLDRRAFLRA